MSNPKRFRLALSLALLLLIWAAPTLAQKRVLFDASHRENAGNADWVIDADSFDLNQWHYPCGGSDYEDESRAQRIPSPVASGITPSTPETYWTGAISAFGIDLVKLGFEVETLPVGGSITHGDGGNAQDLALYDVLVLPEPNQPFTVAETLAIRDFVAAGGGLFFIADHQTSDRDCDGFDSPHIGNDLMGVVISGGAIADHGLFGIVFYVEEISGLTSADYWFTDAVDDNVTTDPSDPIIHGPHGSGAGGLGLFGSTAMTLDPASNPTVRGHVWKTDAGGQGSTRVTFASATYMNGRIACVGDSSPADDGTGDPGDTLYLGWDKASGGVNNREIHLNAVEWLAGPDTTPPAITGGPLASPFDCTAEIGWTTDEAADSRVEFGPTAAYGESKIGAALTTDHSVLLTGLAPGSDLHYRVGSADSGGNGPTWSADATFTTTAAQSPSIVAGPSITGLSGSSATVIWSTDEPADSLVRFGLSPAYGDSEADSSLTTSHAVTLTGLSPSTSYHFAVESTDGCGNGPTSSTDDTFTTSEPQIDISGWTLLQYDSSQSFTFAPGTTIPAAGYLVLGREASQAAFESEWGPLPAGAVFIDSGGVFPFINGGESFELRDDGSAQVDGVTISMASGTTIQRINPADPAGDTGSWTIAGSAAGSPGTGAGTGSGAGVVINEASDAGDFQNEFVELYFDALPSGPDTTPPAAVQDLTAAPASDSVVRLAWTAPGDDGGVGTATAYDIRLAPHPITTEAEFAQATALDGEPAPQPAGSAETWDVTALEAGAFYYFALRTADEVGNLSGLSATVAATTGPPGSGGGGPVTDHVVISELQVRGATDHDDEFIELYNPTGAPVDLAGWSLQYKSASGTDFLRSDLPSVSIPAEGYHLAARPPGDYTGSAVPDSTYSTFLMGASGGHVFLSSSNSDLSSCTDPSIVDKIGYGTADCPEGSAVATHAAGESLERAPGVADPLCGNGTDSDDNGADFAARATPDPQNSATLEPPCRDLGGVGPSLFLGLGGRDALVWGAALGAVDYKIRRATSREFMLTHPAPDDTHLFDRVAFPATSDDSEPGAGVVFYYFVNATDGAETESDD